MSAGNFILYRASAGSGKTYTLVREFLTLCLSSENVTFGNILAVTFTNKAANEMKAKILNNLKGIIVDDPDYSDMKKDLCEATRLPESILKERAVRLYNNIIHNYSDLNVSTIDSFVQQVSRTFARELNLPNQYKLILDTREFLDEFIQQIDREIGSDDGTLADTLTKYIKHKLIEEGKWRLDSSIKRFVEKLVKESAYKKGESYDAKCIDEQQYEEVTLYLDEKIKKCKSEIKGSIEKIKAFNDVRGIGFDEYNSVLVTLLNNINKDFCIPPNKLVSGKILPEILSYEKKWNKGKNVWPKEDGDELIGYFKNIVENNKSLYLINIINKDIYLYILRSDLMGVINHHINETNKVHISEFNKRISDVIADCSVPFIYERIGSKYEHMFIDEFQDTSLLQWFNFLPLVSNSISNGNKTLLVGDAKQAIYRFRSGEVEQIIKLPEIHNKPMECVDGNMVVAAPFDEYENGIVASFVEHELETNYRSKKNVIVFNNSFFNFAKDYLSEGYRDVYAKSKPQRYKEKEGAYEGCVNVKVFDYGKDGESYKNNVKEAMLADIKSICGSKDFKYSDIAILVRNKEDGTKIAEFLSKNNIPVISSDSVLLRSSDKIQLIIFTLKYMMDEKNKVNKLNLSFYQNICRNETTATCDLSEALKYDIKYDELNELRTSALSLYDLCVKIIKMYGFTIVDDVFLQYFMNLVQNWQSADNDGVNAFVEYWDRKSEDLFLEISGKINAVQILTIHKSKGLEYKIVMYPYVYTTLPGGRFHQSEKWLEFKKDFELLSDMPHLDSFILPISSSLENTAMEHYYYEEVDKQSFDDFNLMYVAMTRAKDVLYLYTHNKVSKEKGNIFNDYFSNSSGCQSIEHDDLLKVRFDKIKEFENSDECSDGIYEEFQFGKVKYVPSEEKVDANEIKLSQDNPVPDLIDWSEYMVFKEDDNDEDSESTERGKVVHEICSKIITMKDAEKVLRFYVNNGSIDEDESERLLKKFEKISSDERVGLAYSDKAIVRNEMDILTEDGVKKRPDRYAELDDKVILIDYKTGKKNEKYEQQLKEYASILQQMGVSKNIELYLVYLDEENEVEPVFLDRLFY